MHITIDSVEISVCTANQLPHMVDAIVEEQDTNLLLDTNPVIQDTRESYRSLVKKMKRQKSLLPGQVIIKNTIPAKLTAIIYDIERTPVCNEAVLAKVINNLLDTINRNKLKSVAMPLLGNTHGKIPERVFIKLLQESLIIRNPVYPGKIILMVPPAKIDYIKAVFVDTCND
jgi:hypothetical protein